MTKALRWTPDIDSRGGPPPGDELWDRLGACHRQMRSELRAVVLRHGIYLSEYRALARLRTEARTLSQLAESLGLTPASMTDLARQLETRGWVKRGPNPADRRSQLLQSTATGTAVYVHAHREYRARLADVYSSLTPSTRRSLDRGLRELSRVLTERSGGSEGTSAVRRPLGGRPRSGARADRSDRRRTGSEAARGRRSER